MNFPDPPPGAPVREVAFRLPDLPGVRDFVAVHARRLGMSEDHVGDFLLAVNEVTTNAVTHGAPAKAYLRVWTDHGDLVVEVHDQGDWTPGFAPGRAAPGPYATSGMGLWVARVLAADIVFRTSEDGSTVTMRFTVPG
ncbi:ATP-binding protein [Nonomuraea sp. NPDC046570]|uniref:ATP-binding protein n=1 Tax=Nonomuraea sp. NPDC046570 TaxID=3155255 RepID=UPI0033D7F2B2